MRATDDGGEEAVRYLVLADVHANLEALEAVLADAGEWDATLCLGDLVGYGPNPNECVERVQGLPNLTTLAGNHDLAALGRLDLAAFNDYARRAAEWTGRRLSPAVRRFLEGLEPALDQQKVYLAHASPRDPVWEYMEWDEQGPPNFHLFRQHACLVGHTHVPRVFEEAVDPKQPGPVWEPDAGATVDLGSGPRKIVNPGGVGQPRDHDPRAAYATFEDGSGDFKFRRVPYDIAATQEKILAAGLPSPLAQRLAIGM